MGYGYGGQMGYGYGGNMMYGFGGWILLIVIIALAGAVIYYLVMQTRNAPRPGKPVGETALDILKKRFARGEISREEFQSMKKDLQDPS
jgi:putative membrane protein